jgi:3-deoxy-7-phosphoheptulonate synthase
MKITPIPPPEEIKAQFPLSDRAKKQIAHSRDIAKRIINGSDSRKVLVVGPCSIHDRKAAMEYAERFKELSLKVNRTTFMVMRVYVEKPRTSTGWKGMLYDPHLNGTYDIKTGLLWTRELLLALAEEDIPCATEFVDPLATLYYEDLITWGFIGARTSSSQPHRQFASSLAIPVGFKNATDGNLEGAIHGVLSAKEPHVAMRVNEQGKLCTVESSGNPYAHVVLRGAYHFTNFDRVSVGQAVEQLKSHHLPPRLMIDCSHGNCQKQYDKQQEAFLSVLEQIAQGNEHILGWMLESHLESGNQMLTQDPSQLKYAVSITDPCLDWKKTEELIHSANLVLSR